MKDSNIEEDIRFMSDVKESVAAGSPPTEATPEQEVIIYHPYSVLSAIVIAIVCVFICAVMVVANLLIIIFSPLVALAVIYFKGASLVEAVKIVLLIIASLLVAVIGLPVQYLKECYTGELFRDKEAEEEERERRKRQSRLAAFQEKLNQALDCSEVIVSRTCRKDLLMAKTFIMNATSAYNEDYPGEAKSWLRSAIAEVEAHNRIGRLLADLIDETITSFIYFDVGKDYTQVKGELHKMMWGCIKAINDHVAKMDQKKAEDSKDCLPGIHDRQFMSDVGKSQQVAQVAQSVPKTEANDSKRAGNRHEGGMAALQHEKPPLPRPEATLRLIEEQEQKSVLFAKAHPVLSSFLNRIQKILDSQAE